MGTPLVWSLTVAVVVVAIFALLPATMALAVQKSFKYYKLKITWLRAMFDVHMCVVFFHLCADPSVWWQNVYTQGSMSVSLEGNLEWFSGGKLPSVTRTISLLRLLFCLYISTLNIKTPWINLIPGFSFFFFFFFGRNYLDMGYKFKIEGHTKRTYLKDTMGSVY